MKAEIGNWVWLLVIIFGIISKFLSNDKKKSEREQPKEPSPTGTSFEELLEEIERQKKIERQKRKPVAETHPIPLPAPKPVKSKEREKKEVKKETRAEPSRTLLDTAVPDYYDDTSRAYNQAIKNAFNYKSMEDTVSLEESLMLSDTIPAYKKFAEYGTASEVSPAAQYARDLRNPQDLKKAIVLAEILNRRF